MKNKLKPLVKEAKKNAQKAIQQNLVTQLKEITAKFGEGSKKLEKKIAKEAKKLAKKLAKDIKIEAVLVKTEEKPNVAEVPKVAPKAAPKVKTAAEPVAKKAPAKPTV
jgi:L-fucose isomerase-like protein